MVRLGQKLKEERLARGLSVEQVAKATKIRPQFITAIEQSAYRNLPSKAYARGFVKNYISFLELPMRDCLAMFRREFDEKEYVDVLPESFIKKKNIPLKKNTWIGAVLIVAVIIVGLAGFILYQYRAAIFSPSLTVSKPVENGVLNAGTVEISGTTDTGASVTINNQAVYVDGDGNFSKIITVFPGRNAVTIVSVNKFGKSTVIKRNIPVR